MTLKYVLESIALAVVLTALSYVLTYTVTSWLGAPFILNWLEVFAVFTSYSTTWLCTRQSRWNYPIGIVTTAAYSVLFWQWGMVALSIFNLYLVFSLIYGWFRWGADGNSRPVTKVEPIWYLGYGVMGLLVLGLFLGANMIFNPVGISELNPIDVGLAVASGIAQLLLDNKKLETWFVWAGVNIVSIPFFFIGGLYLVGFQYIFFLINTRIGYKEWKKSMPVKESFWRGEQ